LFHPRIELFSALHKKRAESSKNSLRELNLALHKKRAESSRNSLRELFLEKTIRNNSMVSARHFDGRVCEWHLGCATHIRSGAGYAVGKVQMVTLHLIIEQYFYSYNMSFVTGFGAMGKKEGFGVWKGRQRGRKGRRQ